jgi:hypothetical protein
VEGAVRCEPVSLSGANFAVNGHREPSNGGKSNKK